MQYLDDIKDKKSKKLHQERQDYEVDKIVSATKASAEKVAKAVESTKKDVQDVKVVNQQKLDIKHEHNFAPVLDGLVSLKESIDAIPSSIVIPKNEKVDKVSVSNLKDYSDKLDKLINAFESVDFSPQINVQSPDVSVKAPKVDFTPLIEAISGKEAPTTFPDIDSFRAQDINEQEKGVQYIGFVHPSGAWYIARNDIDNDSIRYKFGLDNYTEWFENPFNYKYQTLDKAIDEVQA